MIYRKYTVKIPEDTFPQNDGRVNVIATAYPIYKRVCVGRVCGEGVMHPGREYFLRYQDEWKEQYPDEPDMIHPTSIGAGLFTFALEIGTDTGIYPALSDVYGVEAANGIMDFAMYDVLLSSDCADSFKAGMADKMLFSILPKDDAWYSNLFNHTMDGHRNKEIINRWIWTCIRCGLTEVYLSIEGTNIVFTGQEHDPPEEKTDPVSCIWVICASGEHSGLPLTYFVLESNTVDSEALGKIIEFLNHYKLHVNGALVDKNYCTEDVIRTLQEADIDYFARLKKNDLSYRQILDKYKRTIKDNLYYSLGEGRKYGLVNRGHILPSLDFESNIALIYDTENGAFGRTDLLKEVYKEQNALNDRLKNGEIPGIAAKYKDFLSVDYDTKSVRIDVRKLQDAVDSKGYYAIGTSVNASAAEIDRIFELREASAKSFATLKTIFELNTIKVTSQTGINNLLFSLFVAAILRSEIMNSCRRHELDVDKTVSELSGIGYILNSSYYACSGPLPIRLVPLFSDFNLNEKCIQSFEKIANLRYQADEGHVCAERRWKIRKNIENSSSGTDLQTFKFESADADAKGPTPAGHTEDGAFPDMDSSREGDSNAGSNAESKVPKKRGRKPKPKVEKPKGPGRGRVKGSKNKKTLERERLIAEGKLEPPKKRPKGRPRSPERIEREARWKRIREIAREKGIDLPEKRKPGYPSKIIKEIEALIDQEEQG